MLQGQSEMAPLPIGIGAVGSRDANSIHRLGRSAKPVTRVAR
jgi:hypothetical protein